MLPQEFAAALKSTDWWCMIHSSISQLL